MKTWWNTSPAHGQFPSCTPAVLSDKLFILDILPHLLVKRFFSIIFLFQRVKFSFEFVNEPLSSHMASRIH